MGNSRCPRSIRAGQLDACRAPEVRERVERCSDAATGEEHVVDEHDPAAVDIRWYVRSLNPRREFHLRQVVAVKADIEGADRNGTALELLEGRGKPVGDRDAPRAHADDDYVFDAAVALDDLMGDAADSAAYIFGGKDDVIVHSAAPEQEKTLSPPLRFEGTVMRMWGAPTGACAISIFALLGGLTGPL